jgi:hypothetical protein
MGFLFEQHTGWWLGIWFKVMICGGYGFGDDELKDW